MARYGRISNPNPDAHTVVLRTPHPPPAVQPTVVARACRRHWTRFASVGLIVWSTSIGCIALSSPVKAHNYETGTSSSMSPSLAADPSPSLSSLPLRTSRKYRNDIYKQAIHPADRATTKRHQPRPQRQYLDDNTPTRSPSNPPLNRVSRSLPSSKDTSSAQHSTTK